MIDLIRSEWIKLRSVRSTVACLVVAGAVSVLIALAAVGQGIDGTAHLTDVNVGLGLASLIFGALGVQVIGQEHRFGTIRPTFTAMPRRARVLVAKLVVVTTACAATAVVALAGCALVASLLLDRFAIDGVDRRAALGTVLFAMGWSAFGMGVGAIVRQPVAGILLVVAEAFVVENVVASVLGGLYRWMPFASGSQMATRPDGRGGELLSAGPAGAYFFAVVAVVWTVGAVLTCRRDA